MTRPSSLGVVTFVRGVFQRLTGVGLARTAAALSFTTVLGLVPLFTVAFVYVARYPLFERSLQALEGFLVRHLLPGSGAAIRPYLDGFTAKAANLQGIGIAIVVVTAIFLVATIEREINAIWGTREPRSMLRRLAVYGLGVTLGPLAIGSAVYSTNWLLEASLAARRRRHRDPGRGAAARAQARVKRFLAGPPRARYIARVS